MRDRQGATSARSRFPASALTGNRIGRALSYLVGALATWLATHPSPEPPRTEQSLGKGEHPSRIGSWEVLNILGRGASATVYRVTPHWASGPRRQYALKLHAATYAADRHSRHRFTREIQVLRTLRHRNVVDLVECGEYQGRLFLVTELVEGAALDATVRRTSPGLSTRLDWAIQITRALGAIHQAGVVHRDLKPDNILVDRSGRVKVADFGLARAPRALSASLTVHGTLAGAPAYLAPESLLGQELDSRSDLYSLGVVLYELFTGYMPFEAETVSQFLDAHMMSLPAPLRRYEPRLPREIEATVLRLLRKNPQERHGAAAEVERELAAVLASPEVTGS